MQKSGRTTGLHGRGDVFAFNVNNVVVNYPSLGALRFDAQVEIRGRDGRFSAGGDSGSLVVTDDADPRAVGLHFAGNGRQAPGLSRSFANPIGRVLDELSCHVVT